MKHRARRPYKENYNYRRGGRCKDYKCEDTGKCKQARKAICNAYSYGDCIDKKCLSDLGLDPCKKLIIVTCMDASIDPYDIFDLCPGQANIIRNAGGNITEDVIRSISISQVKLGTNQILLLKHYGCVMNSINDEEFACFLKKNSCNDPLFKVGSFQDAFVQAEYDVRTIRSCPYIPCKACIGALVLIDVDVKIKRGKKCYGIGDVVPVCVEDCCPTDEWKRLCGKKEQCEGLYIAEYDYSYGCCS